MTGRICESFVTGCPLVSAFSLSLLCAPSFFPPVQASFSRSPRRICLRAATKADPPSLSLSLILSSLSTTIPIAFVSPSISLFSPPSPFPIPFPSDIRNYPWQRRSLRVSSTLIQGNGKFSPATYVTTCVSSFFRRSSMMMRTNRTRLRRFVKSFTRMPIPRREDDCSCCAERRATYLLRFTTL